VTRSAGGEAAGLVAEEGAFDEGADGGLFVWGELVEGFEVQAQARVVVAGADVRETRQSVEGLAEHFPARSSAVFGSSCQLSKTCGTVAADHLNQVFAYAEAMIVEGYKHLIGQLFVTRRERSRKYRTQILCLRHRQFRRLSKSEDNGRTARAVVGECRFERRHDLGDACRTRLGRNELYNWVTRENERRHSNAFVVA